MALTTVNAGSTAQAADLNQLVNVLTGVDTASPVNVQSQFTYKAKYIFRGHNAAGLSLPSNAWTAVPMIADVDPAAGAASGGYTTQRAGKYLITTTIQFGSTAAGNVVLLSIWKTGGATEVAEFQAVAPSGTANFSATLTTLEDLPITNNILVYVKPVGFIGSVVASALNNLLTVTYVGD